KRGWLQLFASPGTYVQVDDIRVVALGDSQAAVSTSPTTTSQPTRTVAVAPTVQPTVQPQVTEATNWAVTLEYSFPAGFWSAGTHQYSLTWLCPGEAPDSITRDFTVSDNFALVTGDVYLRWSALRKGNPWGESVEGINPSQPTVAAVAWNLITESEAEWRAAICTGTVSWDGDAPQPLIAQTPFQH
ncbi:MAG: hypothetical protein AAB393_05850, partial [Bacteroidota bacterium]